MYDAIEWVNDTIAAQGAWAGLLFALIAFGESVAFVGAVIPATPVLLLVGGLLGAGRLDPWQVVPMAIVGGILGYALSFYLGRIAGHRLIRHRSFRSHRRGVARARLFFRRYGMPSLIFGRYVLGPFQSLIPFVAGASGMSQRRFWPINLISGIIWVPACLAPGYIAARGSSALVVDPQWQQAAAAMITAVSAGAALACVLLVLFRNRKRLVSLRLRRGRG